MNKQKQQFISKWQYRLLLLLINCIIDTAIVIMWNNPNEIPSKKWAIIYIAGIDIAILLVIFLSWYNKRAMKYSRIKKKVKNPDIWLYSKNYHSKVLEEWHKDEHLN